MSEISKLAIELAKQGCDRAMISAKTGYSLGSLSGILSRARKRGHDIPKQTAGPKAGQRFAMAIRQEVAKPLARHAYDKGMSTHQLIEELLCKIADDDLVDAILDEDRHAY